MIDDLPLKSLSVEETFITNLLSTKKSHFIKDDDSFIDIGINGIENLQGFKANCLVGEWQLTLYFISSQLQDFWKDVLKATPFEILPEEFQIEILSSIFELYKNELGILFKSKLVVNSISAVEMKFRSKKTLYISLNKDCKCLILWIDDSVNKFLELLPNKNNRLYNVKLIKVSFGIGLVTLTHNELSSLDVDDVVFLEKNYLIQDQLIILIANKPIWRCSFSETSLTILSSENEEVMSDDNLRINNLPLVLTFEIGEQIISLAELNKLQENYVFELLKPLEQQVKLKVNGVHVGVGELVKVKDHIGVRVKKIYQDSTDETYENNNESMAEYKQEIISEDIPLDPLDDFDDDFDIPLDKSEQ